MFPISITVLTLRKLVVSMNPSSHVGQCAIMFSILSLFNYPLNEASCSPVNTFYSLIMPSEGIYTPLTRLSVLNENKINTIRGIDTISRNEKLPAEHGLCCNITK